MNITTGLASDLRRLTAALDEPGADIAQTLHKMAADTHAAVRSYLGLNVSVSRSDPLFTFTYLNDGVVAGDIATSLRLTLPSIGDSWAPPAVALIFYAGSPGAFVDLAADLAWLTARPLSDFVLDQHLTIPAGSDSGAQLSAASVINQAIGVLIGFGYTPQQADRRLDTQAAHAGTDRYAAAQLILATRTGGDVEQGSGIL
jgi:hypothetical protein